MLVLISPAKIQNFKPQTVTELYTLPEFLKQSEQLIHLIKKLSTSELAKLLDINSNLTQLNIDRYFNWHLPFSPHNAKQAVLTFDGEVFRGLDAKTFSSDDFDYAQSHLRILSGLYGVLRPLDLIQPYRIGQFHRQSQFTEEAPRLRQVPGRDTTGTLKRVRTNGTAPALEYLEQRRQPCSVVG